MPDFDDVITHSQNFFVNEFGMCIKNMKNDLKILRLNK